MGKPLRVLVVEDSEDDALLLMRELQRGGYEPVFERVATEETMMAAITNQTWDIIISDYVLPHFSGLEALRLLQKSGRDLPFIIVSGKISEEIAVETMKAGAHDYMSKSNLKRFVPAVERELGEAKMRLERWQTEKALKKSEASYRAIFDSANDAIFLHDPENGKILDVNRKMCEMYSYTYDETLKIDIETISEGKPPYSQKEATEWLRKAFEIGPQLFEWRAKDKYGRLFWVEINLKLAVIGGEERILAIVRDITNRKKAEEELKEAAKTKSVFTSKVSHELRTPLTAMKEGIALVLDGLAGDINEEQKELLGIAKKNVDRLTRLINNVLDFQKLDSGMMKFNLEANDVNQIVNDVYKMMVLPAKNAGLDFLLELDENLPKVKFDSDKITQVLTNLVNNAIKFTEKGNITIKTSKTEDAVWVSVSDTGCGIRKEDLPKLFDSFAQLGNGGQRKTGGTGLGLVISKEIVEQQGGRIWVESEPGKDSKFMFTLPICCTEGLFKKFINDGIREASRNDTKMSIILISIADFDKLKQELSGEKADSILHNMEALLENNLRRAESSSSRAADTVLKLSDENFVIVTNCSKENILRVKGRLEQILDDYLACQNVADKIKLLFGFSTYPDDADTEEDLIMKAKELQAAYRLAMITP